MPWRGAEYEGEVPTLGYDVLDWISEYLIVPDGPAAGEPLELTAEQAQFVLNFYRVDPRFRGREMKGGGAIVGRSLVNARLITRAILSRPKGWGKSPLLAALALVEGCGEVVLDGWDSHGEPVARPWNDLGFKAKVQVLATSEDQTENTWDPLLEMARSSVALVDDYGLDVMETFIAGHRMKIEYATSAGDSREGGRPVFAVLDQTESWKSSNGGVRLAAAVRRNLTKTQGSSIESPNAFAPGEKSVAEASHKAVMTQRKAGRRTTILLDHREGPDDVDVFDEESLKAGLAVSYGESADVNGGWVNLDRVVEDFFDPDNTIEASRRYFLNQILEEADAWLASAELRAIKKPEVVVKPGEMITLGFDGSRGRARGVTDATALIACRVSDGHVFEPFTRSVWEQPKNWPRNKLWTPPVDEIEAAVAEAFKKWKVVGFYADPAKWESYVKTWEAKYGPKLLAKSTRAAPIEWWMVGGSAQKTVKALQAFKDAVLDREISYDEGLSLTSHLLNARMVQTRSGIQIAKPHPDSEDKIDAAVAAVLAYTARLDAIAAGALKKTRRRRTAPRKIR